MSKTFRDWEPDQVWLLPPSLQDLVPAGHVAHFVREVVRSGLDLGAILASYGAERGYPPYHPGMMVALLLYAYSQGVYSSRRIARGCEERLDFAAVTAMQRPDFRTISDFRKRHSEALRGLFVQVLRLCREAGLVKLGHVALNGTKIKANASKHKAMSYARMVEAEPKLAAEVAAWLKTAGRTDRAEDRAYGAEQRGDETPDWVANKERRLEKIREAKAALEAEAQAAASQPGGGGKGPPGTPPGKACPGVRPGAQRNFTDPQSRIMKTRDGFIQGFNAQAAVDATAQIIVAETLSNQASDCPHLVGLVEQITTNLEAAPAQISADAGYCSEDNLAALDSQSRKIDAHIATGRHKHGTPAPQARPAQPESRVAAMAAKLRAAGYQGPYRLRKQVVEPVFGQIKQARGFRQFLWRGLAAVQSEWSLICTVHNLLKLAAARHPLQPKMAIAG
jgi:transposase